MSDATGPGCSELCGAQTGACVDSARTMNDDGLGGLKGKVNIVGRDKQTDANSEIYYAIHASENKILTTLNKTNKTPILMSS